MFFSFSLSVALPALRAGELFLLASCPGAVPENNTPAVALCANMPAEGLPVGAVLRAGDEVLLNVEGQTLWPGWERPLFLGRALVDIPTGEQKLNVTREGCALGVITLSDKGFAGEREDASGPALLDMARAALPVCHARRFLLPDEPARLRNLVLNLAGQGYDLLISTGGTGLPGFEQAMMAASLLKTPRAVLSRALAGTVGQTLILALPGSARAARENLEAVLESLPHALEKLGGDMSDCGRS